MKHKTFAFASLVVLVSWQASGAPPRQGGVRRVLVSAGCPKCHDGSLPTRVDSALAVFDLRDEPWFFHMTDAQLPKLLGRLKRAPPKDRELVRQFVDAVLRRRTEGKAAPQPRVPDGNQAVPQPGR